MSTNLLRRMPVEFGPANGPRRVPLDIPVDHSAFPKRVRLEMVVRCERSALEAMLPPATTLLGEPRLIVDAHFLTEIPWLAGRGYNILRLRIPAVFDGADGLLPVHFMPVLWENRPDAIMTGREEIGYPKLFCEIPPLARLGENYRAEGGWDGHRFVEVALSDTRDSDATAPLEPVQGILVHKYIPRTGCPGQADADYLTLSPAGSDRSRTTRRLLGRGTVRFQRSGWERLPTLHHIVDRLSAIDMREVIHGGIAFTEGGTDLGDQRIVEPRALDSGLVDHSQKMTAAARAIAEKKTVGQRS